jgi:hypothetical protein
MKELLKDHHRVHHKSISYDFVEVNKKSNHPASINLPNTGNLIFILTEIKKKERKEIFLRYSHNEQEMDRIKNRIEMCDVNELDGVVGVGSDDGVGDVDILDGGLHIDNIGEDNYIMTDNDEDLSSDDSCDFSESLMLENALVLLPKLTNVNQLNSLQIKQLIRMESKKQKFNLTKGKSKKIYSNLKKVKEEEEDPTKMKTQNVIDFKNEAEIFKEKNSMEIENTINASTNVYEPTTEVNLNKKDSNCLLF